ncbi:hypothetical protein D3C75_1201720 [compost metagenome]
MIKSPNLIWSTHFWKVYSSPPIPKLRTSLSPFSNLIPISDTMSVDRRECAAPVSITKLSIVKERPL